MSLWRLTRLGLSLVALSLATLAWFAPGTAQADGSSCGAGTHGSPGYAYAGHQAKWAAKGVRATITPMRPPSVSAGHVAGWIGVGGPAQGPNGTTMWLQTGIASLPGTPTMIYAEITRGGKDPVFVPLVQDIKLGESNRLAVLEMAGRPGVWRVWLNGQPATEPIVLPGSHGRWKPIATAESWAGNAATCNKFGFRFERVGVATALGGSWRPFTPGYTFLDRGFSVRQLRPVGAGQRVLADDPIEPFAFDAASA